MNPEVKNVCFAVNQANRKELDRQLLLWPKGDLPLVGWAPRRWMNAFDLPFLPVILGDRTVRMAQWGLVPSWAKDEADAKTRQFQTVNAKSETIYELPSFSGSATAKRCVIPTNGFHEHQHRDRWGKPDPKGQRTQPFLIARKDNPILFLAGLWTEWRGSITFTVITTEANELMTLIHNGENKHRMPVIVPDEEIAEWLKGGTKEQTAPFFRRREDLSLYAVETRGINDAQLNLFGGTDL